MVAVIPAIIHSLKHKLREIIGLYRAVIAAMVQQLRPDHIIQFFIKNPIVIVSIMQINKIEVLIDDISIKQIIKPSAGIQINNNFLHLPAFEF